MIICKAIYFVLLMSPMKEDISAEAYKPDPGSCAVETQYFEWKDELRDRLIPVKLYFPASITGKCPVVLFSHGLGGTREGGEAWGRHWASYGYISVHPQHAGSDNKLLRGTPDKLNNIASALNAENWVNRVKDVSFVLDKIEALNGSDQTFSNKIDFAKIGMSGHSFGSATTLGVCGQKIAYGTKGSEVSLVDKRIRAGIAFSPSVTKRGNPKTAFESIEVPMLNFTGTADDSPVTSTKAADRRIPFDNMKGEGKYLIIFKGGDHWVFSGTKRFRGGNEHDKHIHRFIRMYTMAFWDAYLRGDENALKWLANGSAASCLAGNGVLEIK